MNNEPLGAVGATVQPNGRDAALTPEVAMMFERRMLGVVLAMGVLLVACGDDDGATASFVSPDDGAAVAGGVIVEMAAQGVTIEEAGEVRADAGHFHVIADAGCTPEGEGIAKDADHVHFGKGQTEGVIYLEPGEHELCLEVGDGQHAALGITDTRAVDVRVTDQDQWCAVAKEIDDLFLATDTSADDFANKQVGYENIRRLTVQLEDAMDVIDADPGDGVSEAIGFAQAIATAFVDADDLASAEEALAPVFESIGSQEEMPGAAWIDSECGVDIDG
jgi:hypothetical protein